jgi:uncharacterized protein
MNLLNVSAGSPRKEYPMPVEGPPLLISPPIRQIGKVVRKSLAKEIAVPFHFDNGGGVAYTTNPDEQVRQDINTLLRTNPGERVMKPTFGVSLLDYVFENVSPAETAVMQQTISTGIDTWVPDVQLIKLDGISGPAPGVPADTVIISLQYARRYDASPTVVSVDVPIVTI